MGNPHGGNSAPEPETPKLSSNARFGTPEKRDAATLGGSFSITMSDAIAMHLVDCDQCRKAIANLKPVAIGQKSGHCDTYWHMQLMLARYEGRVNNIVAHTEYGDEAPKRGRLE